MALLALLAAARGPAALRAQAPPGGPDIASPTPASVERLAGLARLWGRVKYFHPYLGYREIDWDRALLEAIPRAEATDSVEDYGDAVEHLLSFLGDPETRILRPGEDAEPPPASEEAEARVPAVEWLPGRIARIDARDWAAFLATGRWEGGVLTDAFAAAREGEGILLDLRGPEGEGYRTTFFLRYVLEADLPQLLTEEVLLPALRTRAHSGYAPQIGTTSGGYSSGFFVQEHRVLRAEGEGKRRLPTVILTNDAVEPVWDLLAGLQAAGAATLVHPGDGRAFASAAGAVDIELPGGVEVRMRAGETVLPDGSVDFVPAFVAATPREVGGEASPAGDPPQDIGLALLRGELEWPRPAPKAPPAARQLVEDPYAEDSYPPRALRLLALFRLWNVIEYFFPYKDLLDRPWDGVLAELIPRFAQAEDELAYALAVAELVARLQDSHGFVDSPVLGRHLGTQQPPLRVRFVEDRLVVTTVLDEALAASGEVRVGDVVVAIDGETVAARRQRLAPLVAASTPQALRWRLAGRLLSGADGSELRLLLDRGDGASGEATLRRRPIDPQAARKVLEAERGPTWRRLPEGYGYVDLTRLERAQVAQAFEELRDAPAWIFDMRGYPRGTAWTITPYLAAEAATAARFRRPLYTSADPLDRAEFTFEQEFPAGGPWQYSGRLVVLVDERAISQAEHSCLFFEAAFPGTTFVGSPTNGANGDVTTTLLPGGISVHFTGHDVRHADGRQLQRVGIQPHLHVEPTIEGVRAGRDELLEAAVAMLGKGEGR